jgi:predicted acylesterase/phospholipase RssA
LNPSDRSSFFKGLAKNYGKTALCLSGGASLAYYHLGVVKALFDHGSLPTVITGTSAGSLIAAVVCCRTDDELKHEVYHPDHHMADLIECCSDSFIVKTTRFLQTGSVFDAQVWFRKLSWFCKVFTTKYN